jgi:hypothetical protein
MTGRRRYTLPSAANWRQTRWLPVYGKTRPSLLAHFHVVGATNLGHDGATKQGWQCYQRRVVVLPSVERKTIVAMKLHFADATNLLAVAVAPMVTCGAQELMGVTQMHAPPLANACWFLDDRRSTRHAFSFSDWIGCLDGHGYTEVLMLTRSYLLECKEASYNIGSSTEAEYKSLANSIAEII